MPYFAQEPLSYLTLPTIKNAYKAFSIKITFKPDNGDGKEVQPQIIFTVKSLYLVDSLSALMFFYSLYCICTMFVMFPRVLFNLTASSVPSLSPSPLPLSPNVVGRSHIVCW